MTREWRAVLLAKSVRSAKKIHAPRSPNFFYSFAPMCKRRHPTRQSFFEMKQKTEIILEVEETIILRQVAQTLTGFCPQCQAPVEMLTPQLAAALCGLSEREIFRLIENGRLHFTEAERIFVCRNSLTIAAESFEYAERS